MDQVVTIYLMAVEQEARPQLKVRKLGAGRYECDGRKLSIRWAAGSGGPANGDVQLLVREVHEEGEQQRPDDDSDEVPLDAYLQSAANVATATRGTRASAVARLPKEKRLTFGGGGGNAHELDCLDDMERCESMKKACEEANLREVAAAAYERCAAAAFAGRSISALPGPPVSTVMVSRMAGAPPPVAMVRRLASELVGLGSVLRP